MAVDKGDDMRVVYGSKDGDFGQEVVFQLLRELVELYRLDGDKGSPFL